jgi:predicted RNA-binding Zn-ribbon protein involved in translation (DUF1610 family)
MIQFEKYHGGRGRHTCPNCGGRKEFTHYTDECGNYFADNVGICNRVSSCGYNYPPKEFFADNPTGSKFVKVRAKKSRQGSNQYTEPNFGMIHTEVQQPKSFDVIPPEHLKKTLGDYNRNNFVRFLFGLFIDCSEEIQAVLKMYLVGTYQDYCCFPSVDRQMRVCRAKLIRFNRANGKRLKGDCDVSSLVRKLKLKEDFNYRQIFFGEHLLSKFPNKSVAVVEAEKTAIVASLCFPNLLWLACNSKSWLKAERIKRLGTRQIILYPDADGFNLWQGIASEAQRQGSIIKVSNLIESHATIEQKANGYDLADYLISQQAEINAHNERADIYNFKLEKVLNDESLLTDFETILDERKSILVIDGGLSETEAERICRQPENLRSVALSV